MVKKILEFLFFVILITTMVMSLNMAIADSTAMGIDFPVLLKYTFLVVLLTSILIRYPITLIAALAVTLGGGLYAYVKQWVIPADIIRYLTEFFSWLPQYVVGYQAFDLKYSLMFAILYIVLVTLLISLIVFSKKWYGLLVILGAGAFAFFWFIYVPKARLYLFYYLFAALILYSYNVYDRKKQEWTSAESKIDKNIEIKWLLNAFIIVLVSIMISQFAVLDLRPVQWSWLNEKALQVFPFIEYWRNDNFNGLNFGFGSKYSIDEAGYRTARLGGPVKLSETVMLTLETDETSSIYLRGTVKDYYTGNSWNKTRKSNAQYNTDAQLPLPFYTDLSTYNKNFRITHVNLITSTIFAPNTLSKVQHKIGRYTVDQDGESVFPRAIVKRDQYTVTATMPYVDGNKLKRIKTSELSPDIYKQLPERISERVRELAHDITSKYRSDYDKAKAIEKYLRSNYKYTLTPSEVPKNSEFVDYFLFEGKEGYCTYFATSMAVLLRASDIPCRYVEGFLAKYDNAYERKVMGTDAHAWVEVNFGGYGWIHFEATPAYPLEGFRRQGEVPAAPLAPSDPNKPSDVEKPIDSYSREKNLDEVDESSAEENAQQPKEISLKWRIMLAIIAILLLRALYLALRRTYIEFKLKKYDGKKYSAEYIKDVLRYFSKINITMQKEETIREFWYKVKYALDAEYNNGDEIIQLIEKLRYSKEPINEAERQKLEEYRKRLKKFVTARLGTIKAILSYYFIGL